MLKQNNNNNMHGTKSLTCYNNCSVICIHRNRQCHIYPFNKSEPLTGQLQLLGHIQNWKNKLWKCVQTKKLERRCNLLCSIQISTYFYLWFLAPVAFKIHLLKMSVLTGFCHWRSAWIVLGVCFSTFWCHKRDSNWLHALHLWGCCQPTFKTLVW